jgi:hypothetical protein
MNLLNASNGPEPMGSAVKMSVNPEFEVKAVGAFIQKPGCPEFQRRVLGAQRLETLCHNECFNPSGERRKITRIEVVRIHPQHKPSEPVGGLIEDPWLTLECPPNEAGCAVRFKDPDFLKTGRDALYYVRAIQEPSPAVNGGQLPAVALWRGAGRLWPSATRSETPAMALSAALLAMGTEWFLTRAVWSGG